MESYIENIRKVSQERDAITEELEAENEALKDEVKQLREELNGRKQEIKEILKQVMLYSTKYFAFKLEKFAL